MELESLEKKFYRHHKKEYFFPLANAYREHNKLDKCIGVFQRGLYLFPHYWAARVAFARALYEKGDLEGALSELETAASHVPENLLLHELLASIYFKKGDLEKAVHHCKVVLFINPCHPGCLSIMDEALKSCGREYRQQSCYRSENDHSTINEEPEMATATLTEKEPSLINEEQDITTATLNEEDPLPIREEQEIVTATLAELYVSQGLPEKAIEIYQKLRIQRPEEEGEWTKRINALQGEAVQTGSLELSSEKPWQEKDKDGKVSIIRQLEGLLRNIEKYEKGCGDGKMAMDKKLAIFQRIIEP